MTSSAAKFVSDEEMVELQSLGYRSRTRPRPHQAQEFLDHRDSKARCMGWSMRTGKTKGIIDLAEYLFSIGEIEALLVIAPNGVHQNWLLEELPKHCSTPFDAAAYQAAYSDRKWFKSAFEKVKRVNQQPGRLQVMTINAEGIRTEKAKKHIADFIRARKGKFLLCVDESHMFRTPSSSRTRVCWALAKQTEYKRIMTGTLASGSPLHVWSQFEILEKGALGFRTFGQFKQRYAITRGGGAGGRQFEQIIGFRDLEDLKHRIAKWTSVVTRRDAGIMDNNSISRRVAMTPAQERFYKKVENTAEINDNPLEDAALLSKLQQIAQGWYYDEFGEPVDLMHRKDNPLLNAMLAEIAGSEGKFIVWCRYRHDISLVSDALADAEIGHVVYQGGMASHEKTEAIARFRNNPAIQGFVGEPSIGGVGLPLDVASYIMWHSHTFDNIIREQADERASEVGDKIVDVIDFSVDKTVVDYIIRVVKNKGRVADDLARYGLQNVLLLETLV